MAETCSSLIESEERLRVEVAGEDKSAVVDRVSLSWGSLSGPEHGDGCDGGGLRGALSRVRRHPLPLFAVVVAGRNWRYRSAWRDGRAAGRKKAHSGASKLHEGPARPRLTEPLIASEFPGRDLGGGPGGPTWALALTNSSLIPGLMGPWPPRMDPSTGKSGTLGFRVMQSFSFCRLQTAMSKTCVSPEIPAGHWTTIPLPHALGD